LALLASFFLNSPRSSETESIQVGPSRFRGLLLKHWMKGKIIEMLQILLVEVQ
jgi:hypothetical protein